jgi:CRP/FNR family transcriptional regulator, cyclic AMP receptor protein
VNDQATAHVTWDSAGFFAKSSKRIPQTSYRNGEVIFVEDDLADSVFCVAQGTVKCSATSRDGKEGVVGIFKAGDFFGEECVIGQLKRAMTATALTSCSVSKIEKTVMLRMLREDPRLAELFISYLVDRHGRYQDDLVDHLFNKSEKRLARSLLRLAQSSNDNEATLTLPRISQEALAVMVGTTRPRINYFMNKFRQLGLIEYEGGQSGHIRVSRSILDSVLYEGPD